MLRLAVSACLLGQEVRWNAAHKRHRFLVDVVAKHAQLHPFCPEDAGMGTPRPRVHLADGLLIDEHGEDRTAEVAPHGPNQDVHGVILKRGSPTCGLNVNHVRDGKPSRSPGLIAANVLDWDVPVSDEGRLGEPMWREHFFDQAFCWLRWEERGRLTDFHAANKFTLLAHSPEGTRRLGQVAAEGDEEAYRALLPEVLKTQATRGRHTNVLQHVQGYVSSALEADDREELEQVVQAYRVGQVPLLVPLTLLKHHARKHAPEWLLQQTYLEPYPAEWMLRA